MLDEDPVKSSCLTARFKTVKIFFFPDNVAFFLGRRVKKKVAQQKKFYFEVVKVGTPASSFQTRYAFFYTFQRIILTLPS